jgi:hypothetical protein
MRDNCLVYSLVPQKRLGRPKGSERDVVAKSVSAMLKIILDTSCKVPIFCSVNINRLPPVDVDHVDVSAILLELSALRREVRVVEQLRQEVTLLKKCVEDLRSTERNDDRSVRDTEIKVAKVSSETLVKNTAPARASYAELAGRLLRSDFDKSPPKSSKRTAVVGSSQTNNRVKAVETIQTVNIFVSRLDPHTAEGELIDCVSSAKANLEVRRLKCLKLSSKHEHLYSSYHVAVEVPAAHFKAAIELFSSPESWSVGVFVKRYFRPKSLTVSNGEGTE